MTWFKRSDVWRDLMARTGKCKGTIKYHARNGYLPKGQTRPGHRGVWYTAADLAEVETRCRIRGWMLPESEVEMVNETVK